MSQPKYVKFLNELIGVVETTKTDTIKRAVGDSVNNHRVPTVGQVIRFLNKKRNKKLKTLGQNLNLVYTFLKKEIKNSRNNKRTDAIDINEFVNFYLTAVIGTDTTGYRNIIGRSVNI